MTEEQMYCSQQIVVPAMFPFVLKQYAKAAIRTQPYDLLRWSAEYFSAMANGEEPPVKSRIEYPQKETLSGLTPGYLRVLIKQLGSCQFVNRKVLKAKWLGVCLNENCLREILRLGNFPEDKIIFRHFLALAAGHLTVNLSETMCLVCELLTDEPEGGSAMIPSSVFLDLYVYLATLDCGQSEAPEEDLDQSQLSVHESKETVDVEVAEEGEEAEAKVETKQKKTQVNFTRPLVPGIGAVVSEEQRRAVTNYVEYWAERQEGMFGPRNLRHFLCPPLQD